MELQFNKALCSYLKTLVRQTQNQEQTQEIRLPDGLPDIGTVLGAWGQMVIRSKEWHTGSMHISGGVMAWVLYMPEDDTKPQCVDTWIPFQMKWEFPDSDRDGVIHTHCLLRSIDARTTSARKIMVRAGIGALSQAFLQDEFEYYVPSELPSDIQLLWKKYPICLPREAGEKPFVLEEELALAASCPKIQQILYYTLSPEIVESKVVSGRLVFRGTAKLHLIYCSEDNRVCAWDFEIPFSQHNELDDSYEEGATVDLTPVVTGLEIEMDEEGTLKLKAGMTAQYVVYDCVTLDCVEDAYSTVNELSPMMQCLELPAILDHRKEMLRAEATLDASGSKIIDTVFYPDHPRVTREDDMVTGEFPGIFQVLYYDDEGKLQSESNRWEGNWGLQASDNTRVQMGISPAENTQGSIGGGKISVYSELEAHAKTTMESGICAVCGVSVGEPRQCKQDGPSLIVRRMGEDSLWDIAKEVGTTVESIYKVNHLTDEQPSQKMILIPVL